MKKVPFFLINILGELVLGGMNVYAANSPINTADDIIKVLDKISQYVAMAFWIAAAIAIFYAGFLYLTAAGSEERLKKAHRQLLYAVIAIAVGLMAYGMPTLIRNILTPGGNLPSGTNV